MKENVGSTHYTIEYDVSKKIDGSIHFLLKRKSLRNKSFIYHLMVLHGPDREV